MSMEENKIKNHQNPVNVKESLEVFFQSRTALYFLSGASINYVDSILRVFDPSPFVDRFTT